MPGADKADKPEKLILNCKTEAAGERFSTHAVEVCLNFIDGRSKAPPLLCRILFSEHRTYFTIGV